MEDSACADACRGPGSWQKNRGMTTGYTDLKSRVWYLRVGGKWAGGIGVQGSLSGHSLVRLLPGRLPGPCATVVGLDDERVLFLQLTVDGTLGAQPALSRRLVEHHGLKGQLLAVDLERANFPCRRMEDSEWGS